MLLLDGQVHHDTHVIPMGNYMIGVGNYVIATPSELGNYMSADTRSLSSSAALRDVQDYAGHKDPRTSRRYDHARDSLDRNAAYAVAAYLMPVAVCRGRSEVSVPSATLGPLPSEYARLRAWPRLSGRFACGGIQSADAL